MSTKKRKTDDRPGEEKNNYNKTIPKPDAQKIKDFVKRFKEKFSFDREYDCLSPEIAEDVAEAIEKTLAYKPVDKKKEEPRIATKFVNFLQKRHKIMAKCHQANRLTGKIIHMSEPVSFPMQRLELDIHQKILVDFQEWFENASDDIFNYCFLSNGSLYRLIVKISSETESEEQYVPLIDLIKVEMKRAIQFMIRMCKTENTIAKSFLIIQYCYLREQTPPLIPLKPGDSLIPKRFQLLPVEERFQQLQKDFVFLVGSKKGNYLVDEANVIHKKMKSNKKKKVNKKLEDERKKPIPRQPTIKRCTGSFQFLNQTDLQKLIAENVSAKDLLREFMIKTHEQGKGECCNIAYDLLKSELI